jgi:RHS repeat-associated protein
MTHGVQNQSYVWGNSLISANGEDTFYYLQDHLGSPIRLVGEEQDAALAYDEFGVPLAGEGKIINQPFGFTGYQTDDVAELYYAQARYYAPQLGRFGAEDTHWNPGNMIYGDYWSLLNDEKVIPQYSCVNQSGNLYVYAMDSPIVYYDPLGEKLIWRGEVHNWVSKDIDKNNGRITRERWVTYPNPDSQGIPTVLLGRVDLVDRYNGNIWEIKPAQWDHAAAVRQLQGYSNGTLMNKQLRQTVPSLNPYSGIPKVDGYILNGTIVKTRNEIEGVVTYTVNYNYTANGIINYHYTESVQPYKISAEVLGLGLLALGLFYLLYSGDPSMLQRGAACFG